MEKLILTNFASAKWYTSEGEEYADVTAEDFVTGLGMGDRC